MRKLSPGCPRKQVTFTLVDIRRQERDFNKSVASLSSHFGREFVTSEIFYNLRFCNQFDLTIDNVGYIINEHGSGYNHDLGLTLTLQFMSHIDGTPPNQIWFPCLLWGADVVWEGLLSLAVYPMACREVVRPC